MKLLISFILLACTVFVFMQMRPTGKKLYTPVTKLGILNFEFAYNHEHTSTILNAWQVDDKIRSARENTYIDFALLVFYAAFLFYSCRNLAKNFSGHTLLLGVFLSKASLVAGGLDVVENSGMLLTLSGTQSGAIAFITSFCATIKWMIAAVAVLYLIFLSPYALYLAVKNKSQVSLK